MIPARRAAALNAGRVPIQCRPCATRHSLARPSHWRNSQSRYSSPAAAFSTARTLRRPDAFHSQLEQGRNSADLPPSLNSADASASPPQTLTEKIIQRYSVGLPPGKTVRAGDYVTLAPHHCMTHDNSWPVAKKFMSIGATKVHDNRQLVMALDHDVSNKSEANLTKYRQIEEFARNQDVRFFPAQHGIGHQIMVEEGFAWPGTVTVASDSHSVHYGGVGCLGTALVRTDAASVWATGRTWYQCPPVAKVTLTGVMPPGVTGKDVIVALCGLFNSDDVLNHAIEFTGSEQTLSSIPIDDRLTIANMSCEWGALSGLFPIDSVLISWLRAKATTSYLLDTDSKSRFNHDRIEDLLKNKLTADPGATYAKSVYMNLSTLSPFVAGPNSVKVATPLRDLEAKKIPINKAYIVSCTNARSSDFFLAAEAFRASAKDGVIPKVAPGVEFYIAAASRAEQKAAEAAGDWQVLLDAGAKELPSGCGPCIGLGAGLLEPDDIGISASNRNYPGRMGSRQAQAYLASPQVVAASALQGHIAGPNWYEKPDGVEKVIIGDGIGDVEADKAMSIEDALDQIIAQADSMIAGAEKDLTGAEAQPATDDVDTLTDVLPGFPEKIEGEIVFCDADNISTDGIYPGKATYQDDLTTEQMAELCMENYDPEFGRAVRAGDILVSGFSFGCGSSREQAATSILAKKIPLVVSGSFSNIFSRNSINNALMGLEVPRLVQRLREAFKADAAGKKMLTRRTGWHLLWDVKHSKIIVTEADGKTWSQKVGELPPNVQEVIAVGGLEKWVAAQIKK